MKKIKFSLTILLFSLGISFSMLYRKEILFLFYMSKDNQYREGIDYCITKDKNLDLEIYTKCGKIDNDYSNIVFFHGWSPKGSQHEDLKKLFSILIKSNKKFRIFVPNLKSLTSIKWSFNETTNEILVVNSIIENYNISKYKIISICGSTQPTINAVSQNLKLNPNALFLWNPYYSLQSLVESYSITNDSYNLDFYVKAIIYYNTANYSQLTKGRLINLFNNSKPGKMSTEDALKHLDQTDHRVIANYVVNKKVIKSLDKYDPIINNNNIKYIIVNSKNDSYIPISESKKLASKISEKGNEVKVFITGEDHRLSAEFGQAFQLIKLLVE